MWQHLEDFVATINRPWVLLGDFNDMLSKDEKLGGLLINPSRIRVFRNCLDNCGLMYLGFHSQKASQVEK